MNAYPSNYIVVRVNALSGLYLISTTVQMRDDICYTVDCVNALSGLYLISTNVYDYIAVTHYIEGVNALSGLYLISTKKELDNMSTIDECQCPLGLIPHFYRDNNDEYDPAGPCVNALSGLYLISTTSDVKRRIKKGRYVSMPSRAYTSFLRYPFKNLGFMRFPEPVFAGIYQNILTTAVFRAC